MSGELHFPYTRRLPIETLEPLAYAFQSDHFDPALPEQLEKRLKPLLEKKCFRSMVDRIFHDQ